jgi:outer membrane autotransporter protein
LAYAQVQRTPNPVFKAPVAPEAVGRTIRPAVWIRAYGDWEDRDAQAGFSFAGQTFAPDLSYRQKIAGVMGGTDMVVSRLTSAHDALIVGMLGGSINSRTDLKSSPTRQDISGGTVGVYGTYLNGAWFADLILKTDFLSLDINNPAFTQSADLTNYDVITKFGYKFDLPNQFYIEPVAGLEYVRTQFDDLTFLTPTTVPLNNGDALRARIGARIGTEWVTNNIRVEPSLTAYAYSDVHVSGAALFINGGGIVLPTNEGKVRGELQASVNFFNLQTGLSGFVRADTRFGDDLIAAGGRAGLRYQW